MRNTNRYILRWPLVLGCLVVVSLMAAACTALGTGSSTVQQGILQLDQGIVKVKNQNGNLEPVAGASGFELVGTLESVDPWKVSGRALQRNESTQIAQGLQPGDLVRVRGVVLDGDNWLAYSIEPAEAQANQSITMIGQLTSKDPWVLNGTTLNVTEDTVINGDVQPGMLVRADILLLEDGTWEVVSISPLSGLPTDSGCANVIATVSSVNGNQVQFLGWPATVSVVDNTQLNSYGNPDGNDGNENGDEDNNGIDLTSLQPGQQVLATVCVVNNQVVITKLTALNDDTDNNEGNNADGGGKVLICHKPAKKGGHTISVSSSAVPAHMAHGDKMGACP